MIRSAAGRLAPWGRRFAESGGWRLYVVGGAVRSLLAGTALGDDDELDMTTDAPPEVVWRILSDWVDSIWDQGQRFGTVGCRSQGRIVEITTHRAEVYPAGSRQPEVSYGDDLLADLVRRDFTIGAMAFQLPVEAAAATKVELIDPFGGRKDLACGRLRTPRAAELSFGEDPLRMLRAARFVATLGLVAESELEQAMSQLRGRLEIVSRERCARELALLLAAEVPGAGIDLLARTGVLFELIPELTAAGQPERRAGGALADMVAATLALRLAALLWPVADVAAVARRLRFPGSVARSSGAIAEAARALLAAAEAPLADATVRRWAAAAGGTAAAAAQLATAAAAGTSTVAAFVDRWRTLEAAEDLAPPPPLRGSDVMALLGIGPGPAVGAALRYLEELRLAVGPLQPAEARQLLSQWWESGSGCRPSR